MSVAYLGLGANLGDARQTLKDAVVCLAQQRTITVLAKSSLYRTAPVDAGGDDYFNCVVKIETSLPARQLLRLCHTVEEQFGRERPYRNAPRTLDLDILLYGDSSIDEADLIVPHPRLTERAFVLVPLVELDRRTDHSATRPRRCVSGRGARPAHREGRDLPVSDARGATRGRVQRSTHRFQQSPLPMSAAPPLTVTAPQLRPPHRLYRDRRADRRRQDDARACCSPSAGRCARCSNARRTIRFSNASIATPRVTRCRRNCSFALQRVQQTRKSRDATLAATRRSSPISSRRRANCSRV